MKYEEPIMDAMKLYVEDIVRTSGEGDDLTDEGNVPDYGFSTTP